MRTRILILLLLSAITGYNTALATHIVGGELTYKFLSFNASANTITYNITLNLYQDCYTGDPNAISEDNPAYLFFFTGNGAQVKFFPGKIAYDSIFIDGHAISVPPNFSNACVKNPPFTCLNKAVFTKNYTLPYS